MRLSITRCQLENCAGSRSARPPSCLPGCGSVRIGISIGPPKVELGEWTVRGNLMWRSTRCYRSDPGWISSREPIALPGSGTARATSRHARTPAAPEPKDLEAVAQGLRRGGSAGRLPAPRRRSVAVRRRWVRIRSITRCWVMKATMRISCPHRGHRSGSTSKIRRSSSAQRRRASGREGATGSTSTADAEACPWVAVLRRMPRVRLAYQPYHFCS